ncbi:MAG: type II secretion system F family protein [Thermoplasmatales archaeon]|nr:MAG: type II secretion system F family protein [Thermoplasmatales archaeon]
MKSTKYSTFCLSIFEKLFSRFKKDEDLETRNLPFVRANIELSYEEYFSTALMNFIFGLIISIIFTALLYVLIPNDFTLFLLFFIPFIVAIGSVGSYIYYPSYKIKARGKNIDLFLPYAINFISSMAVAGISPAEIFQTLSTVSVYGEVQLEAKKIAKEITVMGTDNITALKHAIEFSPSRKLKSFLQGIIGTIQAGSDLHLYLNTIANKYMDDDLVDRKKDLDLLAIIAEVLVLAVIAFPILLVIILTVMGFFGGSMDMSLQMLLLFSFLVLPAIYGMFYFMVSSTSIERLTKLKLDKKITINEFYELNKAPIFILMISWIFIVILFVLLQVLAYFDYLTINSYLYWDFAFLSFLIFIGPIGIFSYLKLKKKKEMQYRFPDFLTEVGNSLSTGMNIFEAVKTAEKGNYGRLNPEIKQMKTQLSWNVSMKNVLFDFAYRMKTAIVNRIVIAIDKGLLMGGNTPKIFKAASHEVDQVNQLEYQRRSAMSVYALVIVVCYFVFLAIILILNTTIYTEFFAIQEKQAELAGGAIPLNIVDATMLKYTLYTFVFVQSLGAGLLSGFMMDGKLSAGIRYSVILGIITIFVFKLLI